MRCDPPEAVNRILSPLVWCVPSWGTLICMINKYLNALRILRIQRDIRVVGVKLLTSSEQFRLRKPENVVLTADLVAENSSKE